MDLEQISKYRFHVARCLFLSQDRADITFAVDELCQKMSDPTQHSFAKLNGLVRYLKGGRKWTQVCKVGDMSLEVIVFSDSDWAEDKENEGIVKRGSFARGTILIESVYKKTENHRLKQCRSRAACSSIGSVRRKGCR